MRVIIAEDELLERKAMRKFLEESFKQIEVVGEAVNGRKAIELAGTLQPDLIFMDIKMPGINGLEAIEQIHSKYPWIKFILVSAYDSFDFAKQAMQLGVKEYILKPSKKEETIRAVMRLKKEMEEEERVRKKKEHSKAIARELLMTRLMQFECGKDIEDLFHELYPDMVSGAFLVVEGNGELTEDIRQSIKEEGKLEIAYLLEEEETIILLITDRQLGKPDLLKLSRMLQVKLGDGHFVGIGYSYNRLADLSKSYYEAKRAAKTLAETKRSTFGFAIEEEKEPFPFEEILTEVASGREKSALYLFQKAWQTESAEFQAQLHELYFRLRQLLEHKNIPLPGEQVDKLRTEKDWLQFIQKTCLEVSYHLQSRDKMERAKKYIHDHYTEPVSLEEVAQLIDLSPNYFSNLFKEATGKTFVDYITHLRLNKAEGLLQENRYNLKEISYMVGYKDPNYFSRVFKKLYELSPKSYQKEILKK